MNCLIWGRKKHSEQKYHWESLEHERKTIDAFLDSDHQQQCVLRIFITKVWSPKDMAANSVAFPCCLQAYCLPWPLLQCEVYTESGTGDWEKQQWQVTGMELLTLHIPEHWKKSLKAKEGGKGEEETRKYQKKKISLGVNSKDWQHCEYGTPIRSKVSGYREMKCVVNVIWRRPLFFLEVHTFIWYLGIKMFFCLIMI